jgi:hypothetical protein
MAALICQLEMYQHLQRKVLRARRRHHRQPTAFHQRQLDACKADAYLFAQVLLMQVPTAHREAVYTLATPGILHFKS